LSRNWPGSTDSTGNQDAAVTPGVVSKKLSVLRNSSMPIAADDRDARCQRPDGGFVRRVLQRADPGDHDDERVSDQIPADGSHWVFRRHGRGGRGLCGPKHGQSLFIGIFSEAQQRGQRDQLPRSQPGGA
jgi:hypothetical protein